YEAARARLTGLLDRLKDPHAIATVGPTVRLTALCGPDPHAPAWARTLDPMPASDPTGWSRGVLSRDGLVAELRAGRCPACSAARAASVAFLAYLDGAETRDELRDLPSLCRDHLWSAVRTRPHAAVRALDAARQRWAGRTVELPVHGPAANWTGRLDVADRATWRASIRPARAFSEVLGRVLRADECRACRAAVTAAQRVTALLDATLEQPAVAQAYAAAPGLCLRHLDRAMTGLSAAARVSVIRHAVVVSGALGWELEESIRKSSWSVRYEPPGPEVDAWRRTMAFGAGDAAQDLDGLPPDPPQPLPAL
ncbi:MAG TPA: hypothetical protein VFW92_11135, partial [Candidatus Limnocylindrales bacterium]|nr:hypothetical protein [Candidatus Limnocylindrales bacterium]